MSHLRVETPLGLFHRLQGRHGWRWYLEVPGCPRGAWELLDDEQLHGRLSVNHAAVCVPCAYHETHDYAAHLPALGDVEARETMAAGPVSRSEAEAISKDVLRPVRDVTGEGDG